MAEMEGKFSSLQKFIEKKGKDGAVIAFSGGLDSSTLASVCHEILGNKAVAVVAKSPTYTSEELEDAKKVAEEIGIKLRIVETNELADENFCSNPENRCYYCKKELLKKLKQVADDLGFGAVFEGTNFSDLGGHRPGFKAVKEAGNVYSPWVESGFTKEEIRQIAKRMGLSVHDKPSNACLASRIPYNQTITAEKLVRIGKAEQAIKKLTGVSQLRVRDHDGLARVEVEKNELPLLFNMDIWAEIAAKLKALGFRYVTIDAEGYRNGSMLSTLKENGL